METVSTKSVFLLVDVLVLKNALCNVRNAISSSLSTDYRSASTCIHTHRRMNELTETASNKSSGGGGSGR